jgi:glycosyltransferase involved in cell wall biosynthesis
MGLEDEAGPLSSKATIRFSRDPMQGGDLRVLFVTNMYPDEEWPHYGSFIASQAVSLRAKKITVDVLYVRGYLSVAAYARALEAIPRRAKSSDYDVVHVHYGHTLAAALFTQGLPMLVSFCGEDLLGAPRGGGISLKSRLEVGVFKRLAGVADRTITKSVEMERALPASVRSRNTVLPNGVDLTAFRWRDPLSARRELGWAADAKIMLFLGDPEDPRKNVELAKEAAAEVEARRPDACLKVVWKMPADRVRTVMNAADVLVFPSLSEGSPNAVKEALASELPVVATAVGDVSERLAGLSCSSTQPAEPQAFAAAIEVALDHGRSPAARMAIEPLGTERVAEHLIAIYKELLA